jgi:hypothetical protein
MASFEIADCPTTLTLAKDAKGGQAANLALNVRNATDRTQAARVRVEPQGGAQAGWFAVEGASPTSPAEKDLDFEARATQTVRVAVAVPAGTPGGDHLFRVRVTSERDPDNDYTQSPAVAFKVLPPEVAPVVAPKAKFPWWAIAAAAAVLLVVVGVFVWIFRDDSGEEVLSTQDGGAFLDLCRVWASECGQPAADAFCQQKGFARASSFRQQNDTPPTYIVSTRQPCTFPMCDSIPEVTCVK